ncbi:MAG: apolipoprotein N-acyltransferase, partial [Pseudomonadota bacterium]
MKFPAPINVRSYIAATGAGALSVTAFAPFGAWPLAHLALALLFYLWSDATPRGALALGWLFGFGLFSFGIFWVRISLGDNGGIPFPLAVLAALLLAAFLGLYPALAGWLAARFSTPGSAQRLLLAAPAAWVALEFLREYLLTGFPWLNLGYSQIDAPLASLAPLFGVHGITLALALSAGVLVELSRRVRKRQPRFVIALIALLVTGGYLLQRPGNLSWTRPAGPAVSVALLQAAIPQREKWQPENLVSTLAWYTRMTRVHEDADLILWPESAVPAFAHEVEELLLAPLDSLAASTRTTLVLGLLVQEEDRYYNSLLSISADASAQPRRDWYHKRHLVPFGEYFPLGWLWKDALSGVATLGEDFSPGPSTRPLLAVNGLQAGASICYEAVFGAEIADALPQAAFLINVSNDAWFGDSVGPPQHLEIARMRALETGRYLLRATNTGITAVVGPDGHIVHRLPQFEPGVLRAEIQPLAGSTGYVRWGSWPVAVMLAAMLLLSWVGRGRLFYHRGKKRGGTE